ncbi:DUF4136 domain-containing protein [Sphingomonas cavernae]|uniref:DUF4136 domain-containing protein n=1 Tax=Sphingomonas cavernae TaxID=2320861 RepID=A0A418WRU7_9SPHN|nr:DUF4136 domain-containing protein [Sphingomonas cavernae]RJF93955.1 DUF4136 domain-containing protein [Sphingomonas cavernae]
MRKLALALLIAACTASPASAKVTTDADPAANFSAYKTYYWAMKPEGGSPLMQQRIVDSVNARLQAKGWTLAADKGDVAVAAHVSTSEKQSLDTFYTGGPMGGWGWRGWGGMGMGSATTTVHSYAVGTLIVDMFDARTQQAVWRGTATGTLPSSPDKATKTLNKDLDKMFAKFPPGSAPAR